MRKIKIILQYIGTQYCGWQIQPNGLTIQEILQNILSNTLGEKIIVVGSGRTDSGVHALGQVAHFRTTHSMDTEKLLTALNAQLPDDIAVLALEEVAHDFHAMNHAVAKTYLYFILHSTQKKPFLTPWVWRQYGDFDWEAMAQCLESLVGEHDFRAFCASDSTANTTVRTILAANLQRLSLQEVGEHWSHLLGLSDLLPKPVNGDGELVAISFKGKGFLKHMIRNIVGTLVEVGRGKITMEEFQRVFQSLDRRQAGPTAPARGLFLLNVEY